MVRHTQTPSTWVTQVGRWGNSRRCFLHKNRKKREGGQGREGMEWRRQAHFPKKSWLFFQLQSMTLSHTQSSSRIPGACGLLPPVILLFLPVHSPVLPLQPAPKGSSASLIGRKNPWQELIISAPGNHGLFAGTMSPKRRANVPVSSKNKAGERKI